METFDGIEDVDSGFLADILLDVEDLLLPEDTDYVHSSSSASSGQLKYPPGEPIAASVINLPDPDVQIKDPFMEMLAASYNGTKRTARQNHASTTSGRRRINLIDRKDRVLVLEFSCEMEYWRMLRGILRSFRDSDGAFICRSTWPRREVTSTGS